MTTVDEAREALLNTMSRATRALAADALIAAVRAEYGANLQRLTDANLAYGAEIDRQAETLRALREAGREPLDVERLAMAWEKLTGDHAPRALLEDVAAEYARLESADKT